MKLYRLTTIDGTVVAWCLASPSLGEREVTEALPAVGADRGSLAGAGHHRRQGVAGELFEQQVRALDARLVRADRHDKPYWFGGLCLVRQWIEAIIGMLKDQLGLERHRGRTGLGVHARVAQRLLALAACVRWN